MATTPSVFAQNSTPISSSPSSLEGFGSSVLPEGSSSPNRKQRISMACQYCRHRKIRCCGGAPCRNCSRLQRNCEYAPVPEEVNRATKEKKAMAKAAKAHSYGLGPLPGNYGPYMTPPLNTHTFSPYFVDTPVFEVPYMSGPTTPTQPMPNHHPHHHQSMDQSGMQTQNMGAGLGSRPMTLGHRRSVSVPNFECSSWLEPPPAPQLSSPAMFESPQWMQSPGYNTGATHTNNSSPYPSQMNAAPTPWSTTVTPICTTPVSGPYTPSVTSGGLHSAASSSLSPADEYRRPSDEIPPLNTAWSTPNLHYTPGSTLAPTHQIGSSATVQTHSYSDPQTPMNTATNGMSTGHYTPFATPSHQYGSTESAASSPYRQNPSYNYNLNPGMGMQSQGAMISLNGDSTNVSPTLAPEMHNSTSSTKIPVIGLGIAIPESRNETYESQYTINDDYFAAQAGY